MPQPLIPTTLRLDASAGVPNNPACPVLHYHGVLHGAAAQMARDFEAMFEANGWPPAWRNGVYAHHHFHTRAHEALGVYSGQARLVLGGEGGTQVQISAGDVVVLPAGVGHCKLECDGRLGIVGAYPARQSPDHCTPDLHQVDAWSETVKAVPIPAADPVTGLTGALPRYWGCAARP